MIKKLPSFPAALLLIAVAALNLFVTAAEPSYQGIGDGESGSSSPVSAAAEAQKAVVAAGQLKVAEIFQPGMILQRDRVVPVWGSGENGRTVHVSCGKAVYQTVVTNGRWKIFLDPVPAGGPYTLTIEDGEGGKITLADILFGDVWLAGGQSNMGFSLKGANNGPADALSFSNRNIRLCFVPVRLGRDFPPFPNTTENFIWRELSADSAAPCSAVAYYCIRAIYEKTKVPQGIINCFLGGTPIEAWLPAEILDTIPEIRGNLAVYHALVAAKTPAAHREAYFKYMDDRLKYEKDLALFNAGKAAEKPTMTAKPRGPHHQQSPGVLYEHMLRDLESFQVRGFLWYQGEDNARGEEAAETYVLLMKKLIATWRERFAAPEAPFFFVQLAGYDLRPQVPNKNYAYLRAAQEKVWREVPGTGMATAIDVGEKDNIHPKQKKVVGERLARFALNQVYNESSTIESGPRARAALKGKNEIVISFDFCPRGLLNRDGGDPVVECRDADGNPVESGAAIRGCELVVTSARLADIVGVAYCFKNWPQCTLYSPEGLPVLPFNLRVENNPAAAPGK